MEDSDLVDEVRSLLEDARTRFANWLSGRGVSLVEQRFESAIVETENPHQWNSDLVAVQATTAWRHLGSWDRGLSGDWAGKAHDLAGRLVNRYGSTLPFWSTHWSASWSAIHGLPEFRGEFQEDPARWILDRVIVPATLFYLQQVPSLSESCAIVHDICRDIMALLGGRSLSLRTQFAVFGLITSDDVLSSGPIHVRRLSPIARGALLREASIPQVDGPGLGYRPLQAELPTHVVEYREDVPKSDQPEFFPQKVFWTVTTAFYLWGYHLAGPGLVTMETLPTWSGVGRQEASFPLALSAPIMEPLVQRDLDNIAEITTRLRSVVRDEPQSPADLALDRFATGCARPQAVDALLDMVIALEALLLPLDREARRSELSYRFRLHGAYYLTSPAEPRRTVWTQLGRLYDLRSRLVHGDRYPQAKEVLEHSLVARQLACRGLLRAVQDGFPTSDTFHNLLLGSD